jgi:HK97 family phage major capsid protein
MNKQRFNAPVLGLINFRTGMPFQQNFPEPAAPPTQDEFLQMIQTRFAEELNKRGFLNKEGVEAYVNSRIEGMNLDALRSADKEQLETKIRTLAEQLDRQARSITSGEKRNYIREMLTDNGEDMEKMWIEAKRNAGGSRALEFNVRAAATMTLTNTLDDTAVPDDILESFSIDQFVPKRYGQQYIYEIAQRTILAEITQYKTWLEEGSEQGAFALVAEGGLKPLVSKALVRNVATFDKIAGKYVITEEFAKFRREAYSIIQRLIQDKLVRDYSQIIVTAINTVAVGYTGTPLDGTVDDPNDFDALAAIVLQGQLLNFNIDTVVLNPATLWALRVKKDAEGRYLFPVTVDANGIPALIGLRVVTSTYQTAGYATAAESGLYKIEEEPVQIRVGYGIDYTITGGNVTAISSDFDTNRQRVIVEMFFNHWLATNHIGSIVRAQLSTVKTALAAA